MVALRRLLDQRPPSHVQFVQILLELALCFSEIIKNQNGFAHYLGFFCNFAENYYNMTQRKPVIAVVACLKEACAIIPCQKAETPSSFFRTYKLNRAAELLKSGKHTVSEIADLCGFSTQSHFSVVFKKQFGVTPTEYKG